jgi:paraquat-inducible protein B
MKELTEASAKVASVIDEQSPVRADTARAMEELTRAARALRALADYLERHPESLLHGKK